MRSLSFKGQARELADGMELMWTKGLVEPYLGDKCAKTVNELVQKYPLDNQEFWSTFFYYHGVHILERWTNVVDNDAIASYSAILYAFTASNDPYIHRYFRTHPGAYGHLERMLYEDFMLTVPSDRVMFGMEPFVRDEVAIGTKRHADAMLSVVATLSSSLQPFKPSTDLLRCIRTFLSTSTWDTPPQVCEDGFRTTLTALYGYLRGQGLSERMVLRDPVWWECNKIGCRATNGLLICAKCDAVRYCGPEHQAEEWPLHKKICKKPRD